MRLAGVAEVTAGAALTVKPFMTVLDLLGFVTVTLPIPVAALEATVILTVKDVELLKVVKFTVMPELPKETVAPLTKFLPVIVIS